jgi:hypothetical protein
VDKQSAVPPTTQSASTIPAQSPPDLGPSNAYDYPMHLSGTPPADVTEDVVAEVVNQNPGAESHGSPDDGSSERDISELRLEKVGGIYRCSGCHEGNMLQPFMLSMPNHFGRNQISTP